MNCLFLLLCIKCIVAINMREIFHQSFEDRCSKYSFVHEYLANLEKPSDRFLIFVYHEKGLRNGGFGDRLGGLLTAFAHAIRFKRTLLMKASNGFYDYFQNYHPHNSSEYSWQNWRDWSGYANWKEKHPEFTSNNRKTWEYDLSPCVSNWEEKFPEDISRRCAMDDGDVSYPVIRMASNRAYFCRWQNRTDLPSHQSALSALQLQHVDDLWEASGCILRLLMWPTDKLWQEVDHAYYQLLTESQDLFPQFHNPKQGEKVTNVKNSVRKEVTAVEEDEYEFSSFHSAGNTPDTDKDEDEESKRKKKQKNITKSKKTKKSKSSKQKKSKKLKKRKHDDHHRELRSVIPITSDTRMPPVPTNFTLESQTYYQLGLHFRCGDIWSYRNLKLHSSGESMDGCTTDPTTPVANAKDIINNVKSNPNQKSQYLRAGFPLAIGTCARQWIDQGTLSQHPLPKSYVMVEIEEDGVFAGTNSLLRDQQLQYLEFYKAWAPYHNEQKNKKYLVFITADNVYAAQQMRDPIWRDHIAEYLPVIVTPQGCHIELDPSRECYAFTVRYWFMLALSDLLFVQSFGPYHAPTSSFSRYAGIYGLKPDSPFRSGRPEACGDGQYSTTVLSKYPQGNWYCI